MRKKKNNNFNFDNFGMNMPNIPNLASFINQGQSSMNPLESGVKKVVKATSFGFDYDERESTKNARNRRRQDLFEREQRLNSGEAPLSDYETFQYSNGNDILGGKNRTQRTGLF